MCADAVVLPRAERESPLVPLARAYTRLNLGREAPNSYHLWQSPGILTKARGRRSRRGGVNPSQESSSFGLKRFEQVPVAKSEQSSTFFARRERNLSFDPTHP